MKPKFCLECGKEFIPKNGFQKYCDGSHITTCLVCGKQFSYTCSPKEKPKCCSVKCRNILRDRTVKERYGVNSAFNIPEDTEIVKILPKMRVCKYCGKEFIANGTQAYCNDKHYAKCEVCGKEFEVNPKTPNRCCSKECKALLRKQTISNSVKYCRECGKPFVPKSNMQVFCNNVHYRPCPICDKPVEVKNFYDSNVCCSEKCSTILRKRTCREKYGVDVASQDANVKQKLSIASINIKAQREATCMKRYGVPYSSMSPEIVAKIRNTVNSNECKQRTATTMQERYGTRYAMHSKELRSKQARGIKKRSSLELRLHNALEELHIDYEYEYTISRDGHTHAFDVYLPKYKYLIDCDGVYFHSYISDPNGKQIRDDYDEVRLYLIPKDYKFRVIVESDFERGLRELFNDLEEIDSGTFDFDTDIFKWCRSIDFPYYNYDDKRMMGDFAKLCEAPVDKYVSGCKYGISIINQFHKSIFDCHVGKCKSVKEAWYDDTLLKKCIKNRLIYKNDVDPAKVLAGFNISKIAPKVSVFNPMLAKYLINKYLSEYDTIFDPFSGFSGRMLGAVSLDKTYIGQDLNAKAVEESNQIIDYLGLEICSVINKDSLDSNGEYPCLFTCPPYAKTEIYNSEKKFFSCDNWIEQILEKYRCERYLFVVDKTEKFKSNVIGKIPCKSHFRNNKELVILIENKD